MKLLSKMVKHYTKRIALLAMVIKDEGDGPASASLNPKPADHTSAMVQSESDGTLYYKISEGRAHTAMPPLRQLYLQTNDGLS